MKICKSDSILFWQVCGETGILIIVDGNANKYMRVLFYFFETEPAYVVQATFVLVILLPQPPK
jgi:hypothetical protein